MERRLRYVTPNWTLPRVIGGVVNAGWHWIAPEHAARYMVPTVAGAVLTILHECTTEVRVCNSNLEL